MKLLEPLVSIGSLTDDELVTIAVGAFTKLRDSYPYLVELRQRFKNAPRGNADIGGCATWEQFCEKHLNRHPSTVRQILEENNPASTGGITTACEHCDDVFPSKGQYKKHLRKSHPEETTVDENKKAAALAAQADKILGKQDYPQLDAEVAEDEVQVAVSPRTALRLSRHKEVIALHPELANASKAELDEAVKEMYRQRNTKDDSENSESATSLEVDERLWTEKHESELKGFNLAHKMFGSDLYVHERFDQAPRDSSWVWLVENVRTGKAELWRGCDLTRIARRGQKRNKDDHGIFGVGGDSKAELAQWVHDAEERLKEIKEQTSADLQGAIDAAHLDERPSLPSKEEEPEKQPSNLIKMRQFCDEHVRSKDVQGWDVKQCDTTSKTRLGRFDFTLKGVSRATIEKVVGILCSD